MSVKLLSTCAATLCLIVASGCTIFDRKAANQPLLFTCDSAVADLNDYYSGGTQPSAKLLRLQDVALSKCGNYSGCAAFSSRHEVDSGRCAHQSAEWERAKWEYEKALGIR